MDDLLKTLPQHICSSSKGMITFYKYQGFWNIQDLLVEVIIAQKSFKAQPTDIFLCSCPKTGTTWLKALAFAIVTREKFNESTSPLLTTVPHECIPFLEKDLRQIEDNHKNSNFPLVATHLSYTSLPESVISSDCKIVYIYRNIKDVINSNHHFSTAALNLPREEVSIKETFDEFYQGISWCGPYWDHILGYWKARQERPGRILFLKYEDLKKDPKSNVKKLAEFIGYPFSIEEDNAGVVESIIKMCSFQYLSNLEVNKSGKHRPGETTAMENRLYFRKATDGDWENYFTDEMKQKIDKLVDQKLGGTGLVLK